MNKSDAERIEAVMQKAGYSPTLDEKLADIIIAVACSVRQTAIDRVYGLVGRWGKLKVKNNSLTKKLEIKKLRNYNAGVGNEGHKPLLILTGCVLDYDKKRLMEKFDAILPITEIWRLPKLVTGHWSLATGTKRLKNKEIKKQETDNNLAISQMSSNNSNDHLSIINYQLPKPSNTCKYLSITPKRQSPYHAYVPIMTGCESFCTYCVVPYVRGKEISRPVEEVVNEVRELVARGYKEIALLGENVNNYRATNSQNNTKMKTIDFPALLRMLARIPGDFWIRFLTSNPENFSDELIETITNEPKICNYIHLPFQAGSDAILKKMNRKYTKNEYLNLIKKIRKAIPNASISTDVIVGFPGETKAQFNETADLMRELKFDMAYIAEYSPRPGTTAFRMTDNVTREEKKWREEMLTEILRKTALENNKQLVGKTVRVLVCDEVNKVNKIVNKRVNNLLIGKTETFKNVRFIGSKNLVGKFVEVKITEASAWGLEGETATKAQNNTKTHNKN